MRYIDVRALQLPPGWEQAAETAKRDLAAAPDVRARAAALDQHSAVWTSLKAVLGALSHGKCWYCESSERRSSNAVDHFRPKSAVLEDSEHEGYWWLAFDPTNFRFSCEFCNSYGSNRTRSVAGGKRTHFPLLDPTTRARDTTSDVHEEIGLLLDPTVRVDPPLLWFDPDGTAGPRPGLRSTGVMHLRVRTSVEVFNLNEARITDARLELSTAVHDLVNEGDAYWAKFEAGDPTAKHAFEHTVERLCALVRPAAEFSAAARSALLRLRANSVVPEIVLTML